MHKPISTDQKIFFFFFILFVFMFAAWHETKWIMFRRGRQISMHIQKIPTKLAFACIFNSIVDKKKCRRCCYGQQKKQ